MRSMEQLQDLIHGMISRRPSKPCVSIYLAKPHGRLADRLASVELYKRMRCARRLLEGAFSREEAAEYLRPIFRVSREELMAEAPGTLAVFHSPELSACVRLPEPAPERTIVADSFHIKPLVAAMQAEDPDGGPGETVRACAEALRSGKAATWLFEVAEALKASKVRRLWVAEDLTVWGILSREQGTVVVHHAQLNERDGDVLDDLCEWAIEQGAQVDVLPARRIPGQHAVVAELKE